MVKRKPARRRRRPSPARGVELKRDLPALPEAAERALQDVMQALDDGHCPCGDLDEVRMALREALNNAMRHGSHLNPRKRIRLFCRCDPTHGLRIVVRDEGAGFDPAAVPDPTQPENLERFSGRGIFMIRRLMDEVEFHDAGREIHMRRHCQP